MTIQADAVASAVLSQFQKLPAKRKPSVRDNGLHEWVPLSGIVAQGMTVGRVLRSLQRLFVLKIKSMTLTSLRTRIPEMCGVGVSHREGSAHDPCILPLFLLACIDTGWAITSSLVDVSMMQIYSHFSLSSPGLA